MSVLALFCAASVTARRSGNGARRIKAPARRVFLAGVRGRRGR